MGLASKKVLTVPPNGQISIGKAWAGKQISVETVDDNQIVITAGTFIPAHQEMFYTREAKAKLDSFNEWSQKNPPKKTGFRELRKKLAKEK
ncbi:MAG: hypothetical protein HY537_17670 [Deltaproteobacteria bacterium]|nr:hypothetical protein [Deltaproteobacteria bacterium]